MKKFADKDILKKCSEIEEGKSRKFTTFKDFRKQFGEYLQAKKGRHFFTRPVARPHIEIFQQPEKR